MTYCSYKKKKKKEKKQSIHKASMAQTQKAHSYMTYCLNKKNKIFFFLYRLQIRYI